MAAFIERVRSRLHLIVTLLAVWLVFTSPWVAMPRRLPRDPGFFDHAHVWLGIAALVLGVVYCADCLRDGGWRLVFPWLSGQHSTVLDDLRGLARGRIPAAEGGGLLGAIAGLTLLAFLAAAVTGAAWFLSQGSGAALDWRGHHIVAVRAFIGLLVIHAVAVSLHILDFVTD